jgi:helicase-like protein
VKDYAAFLEGKSQHGADAGFEPVWLPDWLFDFQASLTDYGIRKGRGGLFADCGLGKTPMELVWSENVIRYTAGRVLILSPLAVGAQIAREAEKFGIEAHRSGDGSPKPNITIANYERLHHFNPGDFAGVVCDESGILKSFDGVRRGIITEFLRRVPYRLLATAMAAPNDYTELGTSSEAIGYLGHMDMLNRFFKNDQGNSSTGRGYLGAVNGWRFKHHAEQPFWRWVCSWARACRKPSDLGFDDARFILPPLEERETIVKASVLPDGYLVEVEAADLKEKRAVSRRTIRDRCEAAVEKVAGTGQPAVIWCHLNDEADLLAEMIDDAEQVSGIDSDDAKEATFDAFTTGALRVLVIKPRIGAWGLNWQHCNHVVYFPTDSYEQYYQAVRRCWRFGQTRPVIVDLIGAEGLGRVMTNLRRKAGAADRMFSALVAHMNEAAAFERRDVFPLPLEVPAWL